MMTERINIKDYLDKYTAIPLIDVRTPAEYEVGHIPHAFNVPLFSNEERAHIGTVYKQQSREKAIEIGRSYASKKLDWYLSETGKVSSGGPVIIHCWRGGMRSEAFAEHLVKNGFSEVYVIEGGYKAFRRTVLEVFKKPYRIYILGGYTGSGKTRILKELAGRGEQVIDLEGIAHHKGSAFGAIGEKKQPTNEQFSNLLFWKWRKLDLDQPVWLEDESMQIGKVTIPEVLFNRMRNAPAFFLVIPEIERIRLLVEEYTGIDAKLLKEAVQRISKKLGGDRTREALEAIEREDFHSAAKIALEYYDAYYRKGLKKRDPEKVLVVESETIAAPINAKKLIQIKNEYNLKSWTVS